ncbi:MAG TPA: hypothetical protein VHD88_07985 [Pyrinomonadaceae bacterium]|nr:hypothetical protein [Pyrinomonadaceae bacterium]
MTELSFLIVRVMSAPFVPALVAPAPEPPKSDVAKKDEKNSQQGNASVSISSDTNQSKADDKTQTKPDEDVVETETIKAKRVLTLLPFARDRA